MNKSVKRLETCLESSPCGLDILIVWGLTEEGVRESIWMKLAIASEFKGKRRTGIAWPYDEYSFCDDSALVEKLRFYWGPWRSLSLPTRAHWDVRITRIQLYSRTSQLSTRRSWQSARMNQPIWIALVSIIGVIVWCMHKIKDCIGARFSCHSM